MSRSRDVARVLTLLPGRFQETPWTRRHRVEPNAGGWFDVTSARSGEAYRVTPTGGDAATCTCPAGERGFPCSHVVAVREFAVGVICAQTLARMKEDR